jgi:hypothetical protein
MKLFGTKSFQGRLGGQNGAGSESKLKEFVKNFVEYL